MTPHLNDVATAELEDWGPLEEATGSEMPTAGLEVWADGDVVRRHLGVHPGTVVLDPGGARGHPPGRRSDDGHP